MLVAYCSFFLMLAQHNSILLFKKYLLEAISKEDLVLLLSGHTTVQNLDTQTSNYSK